MYLVPCMFSTRCDYVSHRIYVCGRANTVGVGVDEALTRILTEHPIPGMGNLTPKEFLSAMRHDYRYGLRSSLACGFLLTTLVYGTGVQVVLRCFVLIENTDRSRVFL